MKKVLLSVCIVLSMSFLFSVACAESNAISREKFCEIMIDVSKKFDVKLESENESEIIFDDTNNDAILTIAKLGVMKGKGDNLFAPNDSLTRQEAATALYRYIDILVKNSNINSHPDYIFDDDWKIADWSKDAIDYLYYYGIIVGTAEYVISPLDNLTEEQALILAERVINNKGEFDAVVETPDFTWSIEPEYDGLIQDTWFSGGLCAVKNKDGYGYINNEGKNVIKHKYDFGGPFSCGMARIEIDGKYGYIDKSGNTIIPIEFDENSRDFSEDMAVVEQNGKFGFVDKTGNIVIPIQYDNAYDFKEGVAPVKKNGLYGFIDKNGNTVIEFKFKWAGSFAEGYARVRTGLKDYGYIDHTGEFALDLKCDYVFDFNEGTAVIYEYDHLALIRKDGSKIKDFFEIGWIYPSHNGLIRCSKGANKYYTNFYEGTYYYLDAKSGEIAINHANAWIAEDFSEGLAVISSHSDVTDRFYNSYINLTGQAIYPKRAELQEPTEFDDDTYSIQKFSEGYAAVVNEQGKMGFVKNPLF